jgi:hypothetical protein
MQNKKLIQESSLKPELPNSQQMYVGLKYIYRVSQEERSVFWEVIVSVILSKILYIYMCPIRNCFGDTAISLRCTVYSVRATHHVLTRVAKCIDVGGIFENALHYINCTNFVT